METQNVQPDNTGHYSVMLGSGSSPGLSTDQFAAGEPRWVGVQAQGQAEQPRVMLVSVPYAMKAGDAQTVGGLPASAFVLAAPSTSVGNGPTSVEGTSTGTVLPPGTITGSGTAGFLPDFTGTATIGNSAVFQSGASPTAKIGINTNSPATNLDVNGSAAVRGTFSLPATGTATATSGKNSQPENLAASAYNSGTKTAVTQTFQLKAEPVGNDTTTASGSLNLLFGAGTSAPAETGFKISSKGILTFATGQTFPGAGTISGVIAGTDLTGGGSTGNVTVNLDTTKVPQLATANTFTGNQTVNGNLSPTGVVAGSGFQIGSNLFDYGSYANNDAFLGFAGNTTMTGGYNTASGVLALGSNTTGIENTATGYAALRFNTTTGGNTATGYGALESNGGNFNTATGMSALYSNTTTCCNTAVGAASMQNTNSTSGPNDAFGYQALYSNTGGFGNAAFGYQALYSNATGNNNTATGYRALQSNTTTCCNTAVGSYALMNSNQNFGYSNDAFGYQALYSKTTGGFNAAFGSGDLSLNTTGNSNTAVGNGVLGVNTTGSANTAVGKGALPSNTLGYNNTGVDVNALYNNTTGYWNTGVGVNALFGNITGDYLTCIGYDCTATRNIYNATAIGAHAVVEQSNSLVLGGTGDHAVSVGIGTTKPSNILTVGRGAGHPVSDSWETYSSRRWKTNIHPLQNALIKVEQLRGVSYDLKDSGKHEIGVIAEDVGQVVPEVVSYEKNGKDATGVDYSRLTALLIEAVKQQQDQIRKLRAEVRETRASLRKVKAQLAAAPPTLVAAK